MAKKDSVKSMRQVARSSTGRALHDLAPNETLNSVARECEPAMPTAQLVSGLIWSLIQYVLVSVGTHL